MNIQRILAIISLCILAACGGGGGGGGSTDTTPQGPSTIVSGVASKGIIAGGTVKVFALNNDGSKGAQLGQDTTKADGSYSVNLGSYTGPVTVEVFGSYTDEATGQTKTIPASAPLRAALGNASGNVTMAVTPLTDLAVRQAGTLTTQSIAAANALISDAFKVDIVSTLPVAPTTVAFQASQTTQGQKDYALALAAVSQQMQTAGADLATVLATLNGGISATGMNSQTATTLNTAVTNFIANANNQTGVTTISETSLQTVGSTSKKLTLTLQGSAATARGIQASITFPTGVVLRADASGKPLVGVLTVAGSAAASQVDGKYTPATNSAPATVTVGLMSSASLAVGDVITINIDLVAGASVPATSAFAISSKLVDGSGNIVSTASVLLR